MHNFTTKIFASLSAQAASLCVLTLVMAPVALAQRPDPSQVYVRSIIYAGSGCPAGTVASYVSPDSSTFDLMFDSFIAEAGPGVPLTESRKVCSINLDLTMPQGWSYSVHSAETRGFASLDAGTSAAQTNRYSFQGSTPSASFGSMMSGPLAQDFTFMDRLGMTRQVWSPCGASRSLNLRVEASVKASGGRRALLTVNELEGGYSLRYFLSFKRCN